MYLNSLRKTLFFLSLCVEISSFFSQAQAGLVISCCRDQQPDGNSSLPHSPRTPPLFLNEDRRTAPPGERSRLLSGGPSTINGSSSALGTMDAPAAVQTSQPPTGPTSGSSSAVEKTETTSPQVPVRLSLVQDGPPPPSTTAATLPLQTERLETAPARPAAAPAPLLALPGWDPSDPNFSEFPCTTNTLSQQIWSKGKGKDMLLFCVENWPLIPTSKSNFSQDMEPLVEAFKAANVAGRQEFFNKVHDYSVESIQPYSLRFLAYVDHLCEESPGDVQCVMSNSTSKYFICIIKGDKIFAIRMPYVKGINDEATMSSKRSSKGVSSAAASRMASRAVSRAGTRPPSPDRTRKHDGSE